jgi:hypothetical protein
VIVISSDPVQPSNPVDFPYNAPLGYGYELLEALISYASSLTALPSPANRLTGQGRGAEATSRLQRWVSSRTSASGEAHFFHLRMCPSVDDDVAQPLVWSISATAQSRINGYLGDGNSCSQANAEALDQLSRLLQSPASQRRATFNRSPF